jgi:hypothetical protein
MTDEQEPEEETAADDSAERAPTEDEELAPARYEPTDADAEGFAPKLPWGLIVLGALVFVLGIGGYFYNEHVELAALREQIVGEYAQGVEPDARRLRGFREQLEDMIIEAASRPPETHADAELRFAAMHDARGLYLRILAADASSREDIARGSTRMMPDSFTRCLGLAPTSLRGLFERGEFLATSWPERLRTANTRLRLRVIQDELRRHIRRDLPLFNELLDADYFLLTLEESDGAFDVFLWDLHSGRRLLSTHARPSGLLLPVRIDLPGLEPGPRYRRQPHPVGAAECSIAAHVKALTGEDTMSFGSRIDAGTPAETTDAGAAGADAREEAGARDASARDAGMGNRPDVPAATE